MSRDAAALVRVLVLAALLAVAGCAGTPAGAGCRAFLGMRQVSGHVLTLDVTRDDVGCPGDLGHRDGRVLAVLDAAPKFAIDGDELTLTAPNGRGLIYRV